VRCRAIRPFRFALDMPPLRDTARRPGFAKARSAFARRRPERPPLAPLRSSPFSATEVSVIVFGAAGLSSASRSSRGPGRKEQHLIMTESVPPHPFDEMEALAWLRSQPEEYLTISAAELGRRWGRLKSVTASIRGIWRMPRECRGQTRPGLWPHRER
jgi:hypothetical protein